MSISFLTTIIGDSKIIKNVTSCLKDLIGAKSKSQMEWSDNLNLSWLCDVIHNFLLKAFNTSS